MRTLFCAHCVCCVFFILRACCVLHFVCLPCRVPFATAFCVLAVLDIAFCVFAVYFSFCVLVIPFTALHVACLCLMLKLHFACLLWLMLILHFACLLCFALCVLAVPSAVCYCILRACCAWYCILRACCAFFILRVFCNTFYHAACRFLVLDVDTAFCALDVSAHSPLVFALL